MGLDEQSTIEAKPVDKSKVRLLVRVAVILAVITAAEFAIAYIFPESWKWFKITVFITLTIVKAFYIVAEFMHLKYEVKTLMWSILLPMVFIVWLIVALLNEGTAILQSLY